MEIRAKVLADQQKAADDARKAKEATERKAQQAGNAFNWWFNKWAQMGLPWAIMCKEFNNIANMERWVDENAADTTTAALDWKELCDNRA